MEYLHTQHPVVIVGSGPTGLTLANLLGREGVAVLLIERNRQTVGEPRAVSIDDESLRTMQAAGLVDEVLEHVIPGYGSHYYSPRGIRFAKVEPTGAPYGYPRRNAFRQPVLERQLRQGLARFPHVTALYGWRLTGFEQRPDGVALTVLDPDDRARALSCDYLVGCDGANSTVRQTLGIVLEGATFDERWLIVDLENFRNTTPHTTVFCDGRRPCITLPGPNNTRRFEFKLHAHERDEDLLAPDVVARLLATHGGDPDATIVRTVVYRFHARVAPRWREGRVLLAGDAAHLTPPFAGQGMNSGIRDAQNLAWKLAAVTRGSIGPGLLDSYETERYDHAWSMIQLALRMGRIMSPRSYWSGFFTQVGFLALNLIPPARDYVAQMKYKPKPRFKTGFMVADNKGARRTLVGRLLPQPCVRTVDGPERLLDDVLGPRFVLLARTDRPAHIFQPFTQPVWDRLGAVRIAVLPAAAPTPQVDGVTVVHETDGAFAAGLVGYSGHVLLLRPDHYVAAVIPHDDAAGLARRIEDMLLRGFDTVPRAPAPGPQPVPAPAK